MKFEKPEIDLLFSMDSRETAWYISRGEHISVADVENIDLTVNTLKVVNFRIKSSAAFRELITTIRPYFMWAQTSRVQDLRKMGVMDYWKAPHLNEEIGRLKKSFNSAIALLDEGVSQDLARLELPLAYATEYVVASDFRTWISFLKTLERFHPLFFRIYGERMFELLGPNYPELDEYPFGLLLPIDYPEELKEEENFYLERGGYIINKCHITIGMRAQLARHTQIKITDPFWYLYSDTLEEITLGDMIPVVLSTSVDNWSKLVSHRTCWVAQTEIWWDLIGQYVMQKGLENLLPCKADPEKCPFKADNKRRLEGKDPNKPCPLTTGDSLAIKERNFPEYLYKSWMVLVNARS